jgi:hypothetical protein
VEYSIGEVVIDVLYDGCSCMKAPKVLTKFIIFGMYLLPSESSIHFVLPGMVHHKLKHVIDGGDGSGTRLISKAQLA